MHASAAGRKRITALSNVAKAEGAMGRTTKPKSKAKTGKRERVKDLSPQDSKRVKGGAGSAGSVSTGWDLKQNVKV